MVLGQAMFLGLTLVDCVARAGAVEELIHIFLITSVQLKIIENQLLRNLTLLANRLKVSK